MTPTKLYIKYEPCDTLTPFIFCQSTAISLISAMLCLATGTMRASSILHQNLLHGLLKAPMEFFMTTPTGRLLARFSNDTDTLDYKLPMHTKLSLIQIFRVCDRLVIGR